MADSRLYPTPEAEAAAQRIRDRYAPRRPSAPPKARPADPHGILLGDGCRSWIRGHDLPDAQARLDRLDDINPELWAGATIVPIRQDGPDVYRTDTGELLTSYVDCPTHRPRRD